MRQCEGLNCRIKNLCERFTENPTPSDMKNCIDTKKFIRKDGA